MATPNTANILVGAPDQLTTGAIFSAAVGSTAPTDAVTALDAAFTSSGYVGEDGLSLNGNKSVTKLRDWSKKVVKILTDSFEPQVSFELLELSEESLKQAFGDAAVTVTAATSGHGKQLTVAVDGATPEPKAWAFNMKDGDAKVRLYLPNAVIENVPDMTFSAGDAIRVPVTLTAMPDDNGKAYYLFTDDGKTL